MRHPPQKRSKIFRFDREHIDKLEELAIYYDVTETEILRTLIEHAFEAADKRDKIKQCKLEKLEYVLEKRKSRLEKRRKRTNALICKKK